MSRQRRHLRKNTEILHRTFRRQRRSLMPREKLLSCLVSTSLDSEALTQNLMPSQTETRSRVTGPACLSNWVGDSCVSYYNTRPPLVGRAVTRGGGAGRQVWCPFCCDCAPAAEGAARQGCGSALHWFERDSFDTGRCAVTLIIVDGIVASITVIEASQPSSLGLTCTPGLRVYPLHAQR